MSLNDSRPKTKKLRNATPNINLPIIDSSSNKFNWKKNLSESNVYLLKKLPEVSSKECSLNELDQIESIENSKCSNEINKLKNGLKNSFENNQKKKLKNNKRELIKRNSNLIKIKCYLCNNEFNAKQIINHETECLEKWRKLTSEEKRKAIEDQKDWLNSTLNINNADSEILETSDSIMSTTVNLETGSQWKKFKSILRSCSKCGRTFFDHRLKKHELTCKSKHVSGKLNEKVNESSINEINKKLDHCSDENQQENIFFVRKTKPLNSRSTQFYKQHTILPQVCNQLKANSQSLSNNAQQDALNLAEQSNLVHSKSSSKDVQSSNDNEQNNLINQQSNKTTTINYFLKCSQCGRVLNKSNLEAHERYHARSNNSINQTSTDNLKDKNNTIDEKLIEKSLSNELVKNNLNEQLNQDNLSKGIKNVIKYELNNSIKTDEQTLKSELIAQLNKQFNPINQLNQLNQLNPIKQSNIINQLDLTDQLNLLNQPNLKSIKTTKSIEELISDQSFDDQFIFNDQEWNEHLLNLKKCSKCNRTFFANRIKKHQTICKVKNN